MKPPTPPRKTWQVNSIATTLRIRGTVYRFRSQAEAIYAISLENRLKSGEIVAWQYEPYFATFNAVSGKIRGYLPDFWILHHTGKKEWVEIKGKLDPASRRKIDLFQKQYGVITLLRTDSQQFAQISLKYKPHLKNYQL